MKVAFRVDASIVIGTGHVVRCLTLADALRSLGAQCHFVCRAHEGNLIGAIQAKGHAVHALPATETLVDESDADVVHGAWLGTSWAVDARQTAQLLADLAVDWLGVDHYALDWRWEQDLRSACRRLMVIDDLADRRHDCDLLLDQNWLGSATASRYDTLTPAACRRLLGPQYALLKPEYARLAELMPPRDGYAGRILVFLGGSDPSNQTAKVLQALSCPEFRHLVADVVIGVNHPDGAGIAAMAAGRPATNMHRNLPSLAGLMARADLMIGAGGTTTWERMSLGLPAIVMTVADNQRAINETLMRDGLIDLLGDSEQVAVADIAGALRRKLAAPEQLRAQSNALQKFVAATGAADVSKWMMKEVASNGIATTC